MLCEHPATAGPWRDDVERNPEAYDIVSLSTCHNTLYRYMCRRTWSDGCVPGTSIRIFDPFTCGPIWSMVGHDMVSKATDL